MGLRMECRAWTLGFLAGQLSQHKAGSSAEAGWLRDAAAVLSLPAGETWNASRLQGLGQGLLVSARYPARACRFAAACCIAKAVCDTANVLKMHSDS